MDWKVQTEKCKPCPKYQIINKPVVENRFFFLIFEARFSQELVCKISGEFILPLTYWHVNLCVYKILWQGLM